MRRLGGLGLQYGFNDPRMSYVDQLRTAGMNTAPTNAVGLPGALEGVSRLAQALMGRRGYEQIMQDAQARQQSKSALINELFKEKTGEDWNDTLQLGQQYGGSTVVMPNEDIPPEAMETRYGNKAIQQGSVGGFSALPMPDTDERIPRDIMGTSRLGRMLQVMNQNQPGGVDPNTLFMLQMQQMQRDQSLKDQAAAFERQKELKGIAPGRAPVPGVDIPMDQSVYNQQVGMAKAKQKPYQPLPGRDTPYPDEVFQQKKDIAREGAMNMSPLEQQKLKGLKQEEKSAVIKAEGALKQFRNKANTVTSTIDDAIKMIKEGGPPLLGVTGWGGLLSVLPATDARALDRMLDTIKANIGFDELQRMRDNSPTGGALGQVSEMENRLLQAVQGALDPMGDDSLLINNLKTIRELYPKVLEEKRNAYNKTFNKNFQFGAPQRRKTDKNNDPLGIR